MDDPARLMENLADGVFDPPVAFRDLADYHLDFAKLAVAAPEAELRERAERPAGCCAVVGGGGSGKSSLIAAVAASLSPTRFPVRVQGVNDEAALTREGFQLHIAHETLRALDAVAGGRRHERSLRRARGHLSASTTRTAAGGTMSMGITLPIEFTAQVSSTARQVTAERNAASIAQGIEELVEITAGFDRRLLLVVEDTDVFMPPEPIDQHERDRPRRFLDNVIAYLAREFPASSMVAINVRYKPLIPKGVVSSVEVPLLQSGAIGLLIEHYARRSGLHLKADQIAEPAALAYVAGRYAETKDIRRTLELLHKATRKMAGENRGDRITVEVLHGL
ncbi:MAG: hypothetical protein ACLP8S_12910 [Solirubrobacteraceae bacterium]